MCTYIYVFCLTTFSSKCLQAVIATSPRFIFPLMLLSANSRWVFPIIVFAQFCGTSLWFAGNGVSAALADAFGLTVGAITTSVQLGFILGTLSFALFKVADRYSPVRVFLICALVGAGANVAIVHLSTAMEVLAFRFVTGFLLAGIYPVGMKIAADYRQKGLGLSLGYLVGALVLGTASPHLMRLWVPIAHWPMVLYSTSALAAFGGILLGVFVSDGPFRQKSRKLDFTAFFRVFQVRGFRRVAFGYFGHMWELYAFWAFVPLYIALYNEHHGASLSVPFWSFSTIATGALGCVLGGYLSVRISGKKVAAGALSVSMLCLLLSPFALNWPAGCFGIFLAIWGISVIADSPQFSSQAAQEAPKEWTGTALIIMNCVGFALTIGSISLLEVTAIGDYMFYWLLPGPMLGLVLMRWG